MAALREHISLACKIWCKPSFKQLQKTCVLKFKQNFVFHLIGSYTTVFTPAASSFSFIPEVCIKSKSFLTFKVKAAGDVRIALCSIYGDVKHKTHEIVIGADGNTKSYIRDCATGSIRTQSMTMNIVSDEKFRYFWITWSEKQVDVGRGAQYGYGRFLHFLVPPKRQFKVNCLAVATSKATRGHWEFAELLGKNGLYNYYDVLNCRLPRYLVKTNMKKNVSSMIQQVRGS